MNPKTHQLNLFQASSLNPTYEIKRQIRIALTGSPTSRDEIVDQMNKIAHQEGMRKSISKATLDNWTKDSDPDRLPSLPWLTIFCHVMGTVDAIEAMLKPLGMAVVWPEGVKLLTWAKAELAKKRAVKEARLALEAIQ